MEHERHGASRLHVFLVNVFYIAVAIGLAMFIQAFVARPFIVSGDSMDPVIQDKEYLIIDKVTFYFREPARGDVVVFRAPPEPSKFYIKRVIGEPGDTVTGTNGTITIKNAQYPQGLILKEPYVTHQSSDSFSVTVPEGAYFVMGDNRRESYDSRGWGPLPESEIGGRALLRLLPITRIDYLPGAEPYQQ